MAVTVGGLNTLDFLKGALAQVDVFPWVAGQNALPTPFTTPKSTGTLYYGFETSSLGAARDIGVSLSRELKFVEADNSLAKLDAYYTNFDAEVKFAVVQASLRRFAQALGDNMLWDSSGNKGDVQVGSNIATWAIDEPMALNYFTVLITVDGQTFTSNMVGAAGTIDTTTYTKRKVCFWKCLMMPKVDQAYKKGEEALIPFTCKPLLDTTVHTGGTAPAGSSTKGELVAGSGGTAGYTQGVMGRLGIIVDSKT